MLHLHLVDLLMLEIFKSLMNELLSCDDIWDEVFSMFDDIFDCLECFNLIMTGLLDLLVPLKRLRVC